MQLMWTRKLLFIALLLFATDSLAEKLVIFGDEAYAPVIYQVQGKPAGIIPSIFAALSKDTGDQYELVLLPWKRAMHEAMAGHGGITNISRNAEREKIFDFSEAIYNDDLQVVVLKGKEFPFKELKDLKGKSIGGAAAASYGDEIDAAIANGIFQMERDPNQQTRLLKLMYGRMDAAIIGNGMAGYERLIASSPELLNNRDKFVILPRPLVSDPLHLAFLKSMNMTAALERFNKALLQFKKSGEYRKLLEKEATIK